MLAKHRPLVECNLQICRGYSIRKVLQPRQVQSNGYLYEVSKHTYEKAISSEFLKKSFSLYWPKEGDGEHDATYHGSIQPVFGRYSAHGSSHHSLVYSLVENCERDNSENEPHKNPEPSNTTIPFEIPNVTNSACPNRKRCCSECTSQASTHNKCLYVFCCSSAGGKY